MRTTSLLTLLMMCTLSGGAQAAPILLFQTVTNTNDSGAGSLRSAIVNANAGQPNATQISFNIPGDPPFVIQPQTELPGAAATVFIFGNSQPGFAGTPVVEIDGSSAGDSAVGLLLQGAGSSVRGLVVNNFGSSGILLSGADNARVQGCFIGTDPSGTIARPNGGFGGIDILGTSSAVIGGAASGEGNLISGNATRGLAIRGTDSEFNRVEGNLIGTDITGLAPLPNQLAGVLLSEPGQLTLVGGVSEGQRNVISGNGGVGVDMVLSDNALIWGNLIGVGADGLTAVPNIVGLLLSDSDDNQIGAPGVGNTISGNSLFGMQILGSGSNGNRIRANRIGTDATGTVMVPNASHGVHILTGSGNIIGGDASGEGNLISGNGAPDHAMTGIVADGVRLEGASVEDTVVSGNLIGTDVSGTFALRNTHHGIHITNSPRNLIGGPTPGARNVISGNGTFASNGGIQIRGASATGNLIRGNFIGTDITGTAAIRNIIGVHLFGADDCIIGGPATGEGNLISGNRTGISLSAASGVAVQGNLIGTDVTGLAALPNVVGIVLGTSSNNSFGSFMPGSGNVISGNEDSGVETRGGTSANNTFEGNLIGVGADGVTPLGNGLHGIDFMGAPTDNTVGGTQPNVIAHNASAGIVVRVGSGNRITDNVIHSNGGLGIDLGADGVTPNDALDADDGPNGLTNFPTITSAEIDGTIITIEYLLSAEPNTIYTVETFISLTPDPSGFGEGSRRIHNRTETTSATGFAMWSVGVSAPTGSGRHITATARHPDGSTSEFSPAFLAAGRGPSVEEVVAFLLGLIPDPGDLDVNGDEGVDVADIVDIINPSIGTGP